MPRDEIVGVDSEIALTAFLATSVSTFPTTSHPSYQFIKIIAISVLLITLFRRMAVMQGLSSNSTLFFVSTVVLNPATIISTLYVIYALLHGISAVIGNGSVSPLLYGSAAPAIMIATGLIWELEFRAVFDGGEDVFRNTARRHQGELFGDILNQVANFVQTERVYGEPINQKTIDHYIDNHPKERDSIDQITPFLLISVILLLIVFGIVVSSYLLLLFISNYLFGSTLLIGILLLLTVLVSSGIIRLWYWTYGIGRVYQGHGFLTFAGEGASFLVVCWLIVG